MSKPILYYALNRAGWGRAFDVLAVTSEKGRQVYGRRLDDSVTHVSERDIIHRFPEGMGAEFARAATERADAEAKRHATGIRMARDEVTRLEAARDAAVLAAAKGKPAGERPS